MKTWRVVFVLFLGSTLAFSSKEYPTSVTINPAHTNGLVLNNLAATISIPAQADAYIEENAGYTNSNFGTTNAMNVRYVYSDSQYWYSKILIKFDPVAYLPEHAIIDLAILTLHVFICQVGPPVNVGAYYVNGPWQETSVTWNNRPTSADMGPFATLDCSSANPEHASWGITSFATYWQDHPTENYGVELRGISLANYYYWGFYTREWGQDQDPRLNVTYHLLYFLPMLMKQ
jgi:hypothetical protein